MTTSISMVNFCGNTFLSTTTTATSSSSSNTTSTTSNNSTSSRSHVSSLPFRRRRRRTTRRNSHIFRLLSPNAKKKTRPWWHTFFSDTDDAIWSDWSADDVLRYDADEPQQQLSDDTDKFQSWKRKVEAITELREAQESATSAQDREWEDWLGDNLSSSNITTSSWDQDDAQPVEPLTDISNDAFKKGFVQSVTNLFLRLNDDNDDNDDVDELLFEDRVFRYASTNSVCELHSLTTAFG